MNLLRTLFHLKPPVEAPKPPTLREKVDEIDYKLDQLALFMQEQASKPGIILVAPGASLDGDTSDFESFESTEEASDE
jgi:hypothetical protein